MISYVTCTLRLGDASLSETRVVYRVSYDDKQVALQSPALTLLSPLPKY